MKKLYFGLIIFGLIGVIGNVNARDINLKTYQQDLPQNKKSYAGGNTFAHKQAMRCQELDLKELDNVAQGYTNKFGNTRVNPFIPNDTKETPRDIATKIFKETGSLNCFVVAQILAQEEMDFVQSI